MSLTKEDASTTAEVRSSEEEEEKIPVDCMLSVEGGRWEGRRGKVAFVWGERVFLFFCF